MESGPACTSAPARIAVGASAPQGIGSARFGAGAVAAGRTGESEGNFVLGASGGLVSETLSSGTKPSLPSGSRTRRKPKPCVESAAHADVDRANVAISSEVESGLRWMSVPALITAGISGAQGLGPGVADAGTAAGGTVVAAGAALPTAGAGGGDEGLTIAAGGACG